MRQVIVHKQILNFPRVIEESRGVVSHADLLVDIVPVWDTKHFEGRFVCESAFFLAADYCRVDSVLD
jgi:hypothetical protein